MKIEYKTEHHIADVIYSMANEISLLKHLIAINPQSDMIDIWNKQIDTINKYMYRITTTEEYKDWVKEAQRVPNLDELNEEDDDNKERDTELTDELIYTDKINDKLEKEEKEEEKNNNVFHEMSQKSSDGWVGIEDYIDELIKRKFIKYLEIYVPEWYRNLYRQTDEPPFYRDYHKLPYWLNKRFMEEGPTCWEPNTEMFKIHPESGPWYGTSTGNPYKTSVYNC